MNLNYETDRWQVFWEPLRNAVWREQRKFSAENYLWFQKHLARAGFIIHSL